MMPSNEEFDELLPTWDQAPPASLAGGDTIPMAVPIDKPATITCPVCHASNPQGRHFCDDCGYHFSPADLAAKPAGETTDADIPLAEAVPETPAVVLQNRYEVGARVSERTGDRGIVIRYKGLDRGAGLGPVPIFILAQPLPPVAEALPVAEPVSEVGEDDILPTFDEPVTRPANFSTLELPARPLWPTLDWERGILQKEHPALPRLLDSFTEGDTEYLIEEIPTGRSLWDAWDDQDSGAWTKFGYLIQVAEGLRVLHQRHCMLEGLRPDLVVITPEGQARFTELTDLLPIPLGEGTPIRGTLYSAPELLAHPEKANAQADLYSFGAMLYALHVGRELNEHTDFDRPGNPKPFVPRFPDIHPAFGRLMTKTFRKEPMDRFPTDEAGREDPTGFVELINVLSVLRRTLDQVRLEVASWTTTGIVRTGNEDAYAVLHSTESRQDDLGESALIILCDGMGGYEAGEVAAAMAINVIRHNLLQQPTFAHLAGKSIFPQDPAHYSAKAEGHSAPPLDVEATKLLLKAALRDANRTVFQASRAPGSRRRGMGCTAEVVYIDGRHVMVGHVGDSRTYHLHEGRLVQLTRDQTLVNRLVELGTLTAEQAEHHPRRNELQQAVGGQPDVDPGTYHGTLTAGDWVVVCSDGLSNHITHAMLQEMLQSEAGSAEMAARRLVNLTNIEGATDNATVVVIRAT
jgi:protein phosphatase